MTPSALATVPISYPTKRIAVSSLLHLKATGGIVLQEATNRRSVLSQQRQDFAITGIAHAQPYDLRGETMQRHPVSKILVFGDDRIPLILGKAPDHTVIGRVQSDLPNLSRFWKIDSQRADEPETQVLIEKQFHYQAAATTTCSRRAANSRQAKISSLVSS